MAIEQTPKVKHPLTQLGEIFMAEEDVRATIKKAMYDEAFRLALSRDFDNTINNHSLRLTPEEVQALKKVDFKKRLPTGNAAATWVHIYKAT